MIRPYNTFSISFESAVELLGGKAINPASVEITGVAHRDSDVVEGDIFLAFPGARFHGASFADSARSRGAVAILTDEAGLPYVGSMPAIIVTNAREAGATLSAHLYRAPIREMESIGITGTNGKTTVTTLLYQLLSGISREVGLIGTVETRIGVESIKSERTTPEASDLQALAATMRERHVRNLVMEVSSHSLSLNRMVGSHFYVVGFTNLTQDHLDYHKDMESYFTAKSKLFTHEYADLGVINIDDPYGARLFESAPINTISISRANPRATWHYIETHPVDNGVEFTIRGRDGVLIQSHTPLHGGFNLDNLLMVVAIAYECGVDPLEMATLIPTLKGAPGRLEQVSLGQDFKAFVDYAHSPDAVINVLEAVREFTPGRVIAVLGCGGDRDASKRPLMGSALIEGSDISIFTSDNPRSENPESILREMVAGSVVEEPSCMLVHRGEAIDYAVSLALPGDTVIVLGKGHEQGQEISGVVTPFDDRTQLARAIEEKR
jgi:UDP-N-acetylmuramoyl-L-alanyl-D-glutamate--2,6-diaminopimelate ligase